MGWVLEPQIRANKREVPPGMIPQEWWDKFHELALREDILEVPFWHPSFEFLTPEELCRVKAKALVWREAAGEWPEEIGWWMELRKARYRGDLPLSGRLTPASFDEEGVLHCGRCEARWSPHHDGTPQSLYCKLCDSVLTI
jgi:hypothetical protein